MGRPLGFPLPALLAQHPTSSLPNRHPPGPAPAPPFPSCAGWPNEGFLAGPSLFSCPAGRSWPGGQRPHSRPQPAPHPHGAVHSPGVQNLPPSSGGLTVRPVQPHLPPEAPPLSPPAPSAPPPGSSPTARQVSFRSLVCAAGGRRRSVPCVSVRRVAPPAPGFRVSHLLAPVSWLVG